LYHASSGPFNGASNVRHLFSRFSSYETHYVDHTKEGNHFSGSAM